MVQADISQLSRECNTWRDALRAFRDEFTQDKSKLQQLASRSLSKEDLTEVEHYHNQFHIQLINIHNIKHEIKFHLREAERHPNFGHRIPHHNIKGKYDMLINDLDRLEDEFHTFIKQ